MVFLAVVLFTVSAFAIHINNAASAEDFVVHHACKGKAFCHIKPENYPQEEIDRFVLRNLRHLHRMKRSIITPRLPTERPSHDGNCAVQKVENFKPFSLPASKDNIPQLILQSKWFEQFVPIVYCSNSNATCFKSYKLENVKTRCVTKTVSSNIVIYNYATKSTETIPTDIDVDCGCMKIN